MDRRPKGAREDTLQAIPRDRRSLQIQPKDPEVVRADTTAVQRSEVQDKGGRSYAHHQGRNGEQGGGDTQHRQLPQVKFHPHPEIFLPQGEQC